MKLSLMFLGLASLATSVLGRVITHPHADDASIWPHNRLVDDWNNDARLCLERSYRGGPLLFPNGIELDRDERNLFRQIIENIMFILHEMRKDSNRHVAFVRDTHRQVSKILQCTPNYRLIRVQEAFIAFRTLGLNLRRVRFGFGSATLALADDLLVHILRLIGFLSQLYSPGQAPDWLLHAPGQAVGGMMSYLHYDITQTHGCTLCDGVEHVPRIDS